MWRFKLAFYVHQGDRKTREKDIVLQRLMSSILSDRMIWGSRAQENEVERGTVFLSISNLPKNKKSK